MSEQTHNSIQRLGLQNGIIAGVLSVIFVLLLYILGGDLLFKTSMQFAGHLIPIGLMIVTVQKYRQHHGNYVSFRSAFGGAFSVSVVSFLFLLIFSFILYKFIDPELTMRLKDYSINQAIEWMQWSNLPEDKIDEQIDVMKNQDFSPTIKNYLLGYLGGLVFSAVYAVIVALVFWLISRKNEPVPEFLNDTTILDK